MLLLTAGPAAAQLGSGDSDPALVPGTPQPEMTAEELGESLEAGRSAVARQVDNAAAFIDSFFSDERYDDEVRESRLRLGGEVLLEPGEGPTFDADVDLRLVLPNTEDRLRLVVGGNVRDDQDDTAVDAQARDLARESDGERKVSADLRYLLLEDLQQNLDAILGLRISKFTPALAFGLRYRRSWQPSDWTVRMTQEAEWETMDGFEVKSYVDLETTLTPGFFFRTTPEIVWQEEEKGIEYGLSFSLTQKLTDTRFLQYVLGYGFATEPRHELESILFRLRLRQSILEDRARVEVAPQIRLADNNGFDGTPGLLLRLELNF